MAIAVPSGDVRAAALNATITAQQALVTAAVAGSTQATNAAQNLFAAQMALVQYYLYSGRLQPSLSLASSL